MSRSNCNPPIDLYMTAGLPYARKIRVTGGTSIWPTAEEFEVRSQIRVEKDVSSTLKANLTPHLEASIDGDDIVVALELSGLDTRTLPSGYYDVVLSDLGITDARGLVILSGQIKLGHLVTAPSDE